MKSKAAGKMCGSIRSKKKKNKMKKKKYLGKGNKYDNKGSCRV